MKSLTCLPFAAYRKAGLLTSLLSLIFLLIAGPAASIGLLPAIHLYQSGQGAEKVEQTASVAKPLSTDMSKGYWYSRQTRDKYCIQFKNTDRESDWGWSMSECFDQATFAKKQNNVYVLTKETGILTLTGNLEQVQGEGTYAFTEDASFKKYLAENNIVSRDENLLFHLFLSEVDKPYIEFLKKHYSQVDGNRLLELAIHGISLKNYQAFIALFEKYSQKKPSMQEVVEAKIHGIDEEYVEQLQASGFSNLSMRKMMEAKIHGVDAAYIDMLNKQGFADLSIQQIVSAKIHGISASSIKEIQALGYTNLSLEKIIEAKIHGVNASYIQELAGEGFQNLPLNKVIEAKIHGVDARFIKHAKSKGYQHENISRYIELKIHGLG